MKKAFSVIVLSVIGFVLIGCLSSPSSGSANLTSYSPLGNIIWSNDPNNNKHDGLSVSEWYRETSGNAVVLGKTLTYWLYDTYWKNHGDKNELFEMFIDYVEDLGWSIDYEYIEDVNPNPDLAESIKRLMRSKNSYVSFILIETEDDFVYYVVNYFNRNTGTYSTRIYELY
jgi:thiamine kinase-like enzyme